MVAARLDRPSMAPVNAPASSAAPGKAGKGLHFFFQRMVDRHGKSAVSVHLPHLPEEIRSVIRPPLEDVVLPLVNHLVRQRTDEFVSPERRARYQRGQKRKRKADFPFGGLGRRPLPPGGAGTGPAHEHADGSGQPSAPDERDRREGTVEISAIEIAPDLGELRRGEGRMAVHGHARWDPSSSATAATSNGNMIS